MEDGEYTLAADEKHRVEEKQRSKRRDRDTMGEVYAPQWFVRDQCPVTGIDWAGRQMWKPYEEKETKALNSRRSAALQKPWFLEFVVNEYLKRSPGR
ncbi:hypothetical protein PENVUL_c055G05851 [Penicillium vulpinum]|uniref:Uncharacterized protein n=1 Tax=Penicillium vulpinum TaxID=29845 RepID=A0A1V6RFL9_9EURO|nr:hypothetical protein PENVUL_c055G05851 [Penicillium vulpinum]